jgi:peptidyl-prolyl cis-trans isomerase D
MSALQTLRDKAGILVSVVIGLALVAFILGDFLSAGSGAPTDFTVAEINGKSIHLERYNQMVAQQEEDFRNRSGSNIDDNTRNFIMRQAWDQLLREELMDEQFRLLGLGVDVPEHGILGITPEEFKDLVVGHNVDPQIQQIFINQETGQYDRNVALNFLQNMDSDPQKKAIWLNIERTLMKNQLANKYNALVTKSIYVTAAEAAKSADDKNRNVNFSYTGFRYNSVSDDQITITDADLKKYYDANKDKYKAEPSRTFEYILFPIQPSQEDYSTTLVSANRFAQEFALSEDDASFVSATSDLPYRDILYTAAEVPSWIDSAFYYAAEGLIYGPVLDNGYYKTAKLSERKTVADSVSASHILITSNNAPKLADSLKSLIDAGADFASLASEYSEDPGSASSGGELGWFTYGAMVKPFNDTCFYGVKGKTYIVNTNFGVHVIRIDDKAKATEKVSIAIVATEVRASSGTFNSVYSAAGRFAGQNNSKQKFDEAVEADPTLSKRIARDIKENDRSLPGVTSARQMIKWANAAKLGEVSGVFEIDNSFAVACLTSVTDKGFRNFEDVKETVRQEVAKAKKAEIIISKLGETNSRSIAEIAQQSNAPINTVAEVNFASSNIPGLGSEPEMVGVVCGMELGKVSAPIVGNSGVYVVSATGLRVATSATEETEKALILQSRQSQMGFAVQQTLKQSAKIKDNRSLFE